MAKRKPKRDEERERSRAKAPEDRVNDERGLDRVFVALRLRAEFHGAIDRHRGDRSFSASAHEVIEAGLKALGWS